MRFSSCSHTYRLLLKTNASPILIRGSKRSLTGGRWELCTSLPTAYVSLSGCTGRRSSSRLPLTRGCWIQTYTLPLASMHRQPPNSATSPHSCPLRAKEATASRGTRQRLNSNADPRRSGHEDGGRLRKHNETQEFLSVTPANLPVQPGAFHRKNPRERKNKTYQVLSISSLPLPP